MRQCSDTQTKRMTDTQAAHVNFLVPTALRGRRVERQHVGCLQYSDSFDSTTFTLNRIYRVNRRNSGRIFVPVEEETILNT